MDGGAPEGAPPPRPADDGIASPGRAPSAASQIDANDVSRKKPRLRPVFAASVLLDVGAVSSVKTAGSPAGPPVAPTVSRFIPPSSPRQVSESASTGSAERQQIRSMANEIGLSYGRSPGVVRARLTREQFATLFTTMIHHESNFNPNAVSPAGAIGLGQLMPDTADDLGLKDVFSARENLDGSARYLTAMFDRFGTPELALAAYNAGPAAVEKYGGVPPYAETQQYVAAIVSTAATAPAFADSGFSGSRTMPTFASLSTLAATR
jgi:hypothetical protein